MRRSSLAGDGTPYSIGDRKPRQRVDSEASLCVPQRLRACPPGGPVASGRLAGVGLGRRRTGRGAFAVGLVWGLGTAFALATGSAQAVRGLALCVALGAVAAPVLVRRRAFGFLGDPVLVLVLVHAAVSLVSGLRAGSGWEPTVRYVLVYPAVFCAVCVAATGLWRAEACHKGVLAACLVFVLYHLSHTPSGAWWSPTYRASIFLNANGVGFVCAVSVVSCLWYARRGGRLRPVWGACGLAPAALLLLTRSRTASLSCLVGCATVLAWPLGGKSLGKAVAALVALGLGLAVLGGGALSQPLAVVWSRPYSSIDTLQEREETWRFIAGSVLPQHALLGVGPGRLQLYLQPVGLASGAHNGLLRNLAEVGLLGTVPLAAVLAHTLATIWANRRSAALGLWAAVVAAATVESLAEEMFFSMGNPASVMFLLSVAVVERWRLGARHLLPTESQPTRSVAP